MATRKIEKTRGSRATTPAGRTAGFEKGRQHNLREAHDQATRRQREIEALMRSLLHSQEEERRRIARELHDDVTQRLAGLSIQAESLLRDGDLEASVSRILSKIRDRLVEVMEVVRLTAQQLHPSVVEHLGAKRGIEALCEEFSEQSKIAVKFLHRTVPDQIPQSISLALYRVVQDALHNVAAHSGASEAAVLLVGSNGAIRLTIRDSGLGFDPQALRGGCGIGLIRMSERVKLVSGTLALESRPGGGVRIRVQVPLDTKPHVRRKKR